MTRTVAFLRAINVGGHASKPRFEQELGVSATSRNWSTLSKIVELVRREADR